MKRFMADADAATTDSSAAAVVTDSATTNADRATSPDSTPTVNRTPSTKSIRKSAVCVPTFVGPSHHTIHFFVFSDLLADVTVSLDRQQSLAAAHDGEVLAELWRSHLDQSEVSLLILKNLNPSVINPSIDTFVSSFVIGLNLVPDSLLFRHVLLNRDTVFGNSHIEKSGLSISCRDRAKCVLLEGLRLPI